MHLDVGVFCLEIVIVWQLFVFLEPWLQTVVFSVITTYVEKHLCSNFEHTGSAGDP